MPVPRISGLLTLRCSCYTKHSHMVGEERPLSPIWISASYMPNTRKPPIYRNSEWNAHHQPRSRPHIFESPPYCYRPVCRRTGWYPGEDLWLENWGSDHAESGFSCGTCRGLACLNWRLVSSLAWASKSMKCWQLIQVKLHGKAAPSHPLSCTHLQQDTNAKDVKSTHKTPVSKWRRMCVIPKSWIELTLSNHASIHKRHMLWLYWWSEWEKKATILKSHCIWIKIYIPLKTVILQPEL